MKRIQRTADVTRTAGEKQPSPGAFTPRRSEVYHAGKLGQIVRRNESHQVTLVVVLRSPVDFPPRPTVSISLSQGVHWNQKGVKASRAQSGRGDVLSIRRTYEPPLRVGARRKFQNHVRAGGGFRVQIK